MNLLFSGLFFSVFFLLGRGFVLITKLNKDRPISTFEIFDTKLSIFFPILGTFLLGNFIFILNFFTSIDTWLVLLILFIALLFNLIEKISIKEITSNIIFLVIHLIISISAYSANFQYDFGYYHLNYQGWIRSEKIVIGLGNIFSPLGLSSMSDYIASTLWLDDNFILLHQTSIIFISTFMMFLYHHVKDIKHGFLFSSSVFLIIYTLLDNIGINGGLNGFIQISGVVKPDQAFAVLFFFFSIFFLVTLKKNEFNETEMFFLSLILLLSYQYRVISVILIFPFFIYIYINKENISVYLLKRLSITATLFIVWMFKSLLLTSCFIFPISSTCLETGWGNSHIANSFSAQTRLFNNAYSTSNNFIDWFNGWIASNSNSTVFSNFFFSFLIIYIIKKFLYKKINILPINTSIKIYTIYTVVAYLLVWLTGAPHPRFLYGTFLFIITLLALNIESYTLRKAFWNKYTSFSLAILFFIACSSIPRISSYQAFIENPSNFNNLKAIELNYEKDESGWQYPLIGDQCWLNIDCIPSEISVTRETNRLGYITFRR
jgi:hypothetical protein